VLIASRTCGSFSGAVVTFGQSVTTLLEANQGLPDVQVWLSVLAPR
jgi:hypothetical protein